MGRTVGMNDGIAVFPRPLHIVADSVWNAPNGRGTIDDFIDASRDDAPARVVRTEMQTQNSLKLGEHPGDISRFQAAFRPV